MDLITPITLKIFFEERPSLSKRGIEKEAELPDTKIKEYIRNKQNLSLEQKDRLLQVVVKYGWEPKPKGLVVLLDGNYTNMGFPIKIKRKNK